ncbi:hypothetical protein H4582DRAFT_2080517 [Lactarius indigo]|nr:hypothetical protein H4582DRAFT_2080517 [Lactarius indigo]
MLPKQFFRNLKQRTHKSRPATSGDQAPLAAQGTTVVPDPAWQIDTHDDIAMGAIQTSLALIKEGSSIATKFPFIAPIAGLLLQALTIRDEVKQYKGECEIVMGKLARIAGIIVDVCEKYNMSEEELPTTLLNILRSLQRELDRIEQVLKRCSKRKGIKGVVLRKDLLTKIRQCDVELSNVLQAFQVELGLDIRFALIVQRRESIEATPCIPKESNEPGHFETSLDQSDSQMCPIPSAPTSASNLLVVGGDRRKVGYDTALLISLHYATEAVTTLQFILLLGLAGSVVSTILFDLSRSFWVLLLSRYLNGVLNGSLGVIRSMIAELADETNVARKNATFTAKVQSAKTDLDIVSQKKSVGVPKQDPEGSLLLRALITKPVLVSVSSYVVLALLDMAAMALIPLVWPTLIEFGGLNLNPASICLWMSRYGCLNSFVQFILIPRIVARLGPGCQCIFLTSILDATPVNIII